MEIKSIVLQTKSLMQMKNFYIGTLGFSLINEDKNSFRLAVGTGEMEFTTKEVKVPPIITLLLTYRLTNLMRQNHGQKKE